MAGGVIQGSFSSGAVRVAQLKTAAQRPSPNGNALALPPAFAIERGGGQPLPPAVRQKMEAVFGQSFADVRVHVGAEAQAIGAIAYTRGSHIHFAPGHYDPASPQGQRVLARELTHVVQQRAGRVRNPFGGGVAVVRDTLLEAEAERFALKASAPVPVVQRKAGPVVQRKAGPVVQRTSGAVVQRSFVAEQQKGENTCWAVAFGALLGKKEHEIKLEWSLDSTIYALSYEDTQPLASKLGLTACENWYAAAFGSGKLPIAVGLPDHWVVVTGLTLSQNRIRATHVTYFDPANGSTQTVDALTFNSLKPTIGVYK